MKLKLKTSTKITLSIIFIGSVVNAAYLNNYEEAYQLMLILFIILYTVYNENKS